MQEDDNFEMCTAHRQKKYYCCKTCKMTTCCFCLSKHITHDIIIIYEEQETITRLVNDLETYKGKLLEAREELTEEYKANIRKLRKRKHELFKSTGEIINNIDDILASADAVKVETFAKATAEEVINKQQVVKSIRTKAVDNLKMVMNYKTYVLTEVKKKVDNTESFRSVMIRLFWKDNWWKSKF